MIPNLLCSPFVLTVLFCLAIQPIWLVNGSAGDNSPHFYRCVVECLRVRGHVDGQHISPSSLRYFSPELSLYDLFPPSQQWQVIQWDDEEYCEYHCMTSISLDRSEANQPVQKYFGHWPFKRWFGFEEPASVAFSALNTLAHIHFLTKQFFSLSPFVTGPLRIWLILYAFIAINAWIASSLFHAKKTHLHTQYDYISALTLITCGWLLICRRWTLTLSLSMPPKTQQGVRKLLPSLLFYISLIITLLAYGFRVYVMITTPEVITFDIHMKACIGTIIATTILWGFWILYGFLRPMKNHPENKRVYWYCIIVQIWFVIASMLEIFDFPPYFELFDAHSLWHCATIPLGFVWYHFWSLDDAMVLKAIEIKNNNNSGANNDGKME